MSYKSIVILGLLLTCFSLGSEAQVKVKPYRSNVTKKGNFGKYPTKVRIAPIVSFGSANASFKRSDSVVTDSAYRHKVNNDVNYFSFGSGTKNRSQFGVGFMLDIPFSSHISFRPSFMYSNKTIADESEYVWIDSPSNTSIAETTTNEKKLSQFESMFILHVDFGSDRKKTRFFLGGGFGFGLNMSATNDYDYNYKSNAIDNPDNVFGEVDTNGSIKLGLGANVYEDFFDRLDFMAQFEIGANIGQNLTISTHYNTSLGNLFTDPRFGTYTPYYYGLKVGYIFGKKPDMWGY